MAPFRRGRSSAAGAAMPEDEEEDGGGGSTSYNHDFNNNLKPSSAWEARRRRKTKGNDINNNSNNNKDKIGFANNPSRRSSKKPLPKGEYDPYDSDPGESYREHCDRIKGERTKSCLTLPRFLKEGGNPVTFLNNKGAAVANVAHHQSHARDVSTTATSPPSPLLSEQDDGSPIHHPHLNHHDRQSTPNFSTTTNGLDKEQYFAHFYPHGMPASLPRDLARVRYSLRTSIGDGSERQPALASSQLMERRELRPNNIHINVSHWSDFGGRNYMEDR
jgi:hypothetical protein